LGFEGILKQGDFSLLTLVRLWARIHLPLAQMDSKLKISDRQLEKSGLL
jgi:hypothetical protein